MNNQLNQYFRNPQEYRDLILSHVSVKADRDSFSGKSFTCVSFTRFCPVGCKFCFFSSAPSLKPKTIADALTAEGLEKFIEFANDSNLGYLLVSGGGEPFLEVKHLLQVVERVISDKIVLVTSGNWAKSPSAAANITKQVYEAFKRRTSPTKLVMRLSVDEEHARGGLGLHPAHNLITLFETQYLNKENFSLQFHTLFGDTCIEQLFKELGSRIISSGDHSLRSDADTILKVNPAEKIIELSSGLVIKIGYAKCFHSNIKVNLKDPEIIKRNLAVFEWDMCESEENNPSIVTNTDGRKGLDFWVNFNGNVTTWGNQVPDNIYNIYEDDYQTVVDNTFADPISLAYLENGNPHREKIVSEVNPLAVIRAKATNIRDYTGAIICEEATTRLYLTVRSLQNFYVQGRIDQNELKSWPEPIQIMIKSTKEEAMAAYRNSSYSIVDEYLDRNVFDPLEWLDFLELIKLGHYNLSSEQIQQAIKGYNRRSQTPITSLEEARNDVPGFFHEERIIAIKKGVMERAEKKEVESVA